MKLSVIIPCLNAQATVGSQLEALCAQDWPGDWELIVADNGCHDASRAIVEAFVGRLPALRVIDAFQRRSAAHARNLGASQARGEWLAFCDADDEVAPGWLTAIAQGLKKHVFVASRFDFTKLNGRRGGAVPCCQTEKLQRIAYPPYWSHAGGSGLAVHHEVHDQVGGFDESIPYLEDTDYCLRLQRAGYELCFAPAALVHVRLPSRAPLLFNQARHWAKYNELMYRRYGTGEPLDRPWVSYVQTWRALLRGFPRVLRRESGAAWTKALGTQIGLLQGAICFRVPPVSAGKVRRREISKERAPR